MEWLLEVALIVLLMATLFHALRLERALGVLKRDRSALEDLVAGFNASTRQAELSIERLRSAADGAGKQIAKQVDTASTLKDDLVFLIERGERLADRLDVLVRHGKQVVADAPRVSAAEFASGLPAEPQREPLRADAPRPALSRADQARPDYNRPDYNRPDYNRTDYALETISADSSPPSTEPGDNRDEPRLRSQAERDLLRALRMAR